MSETLLLQCIERKKKSQNEGEFSAQIANRGPTCHVLTIQNVCSELSLRRSASATASLGSQFLFLRSFAAIPFLRLGVRFCT